LQVYITDTPYRLGRGKTGNLTDLTVYNQSFLMVPGQHFGCHLLRWPELGWSGLYVQGLGNLRGGAAGASPLCMAGSSFEI
jgi:hypothetical protein